MFSSISNFTTGFLPDRNIGLGCKAAFGLAVLAGAVKYTNVYRAPINDPSEFFRTPRDEHKS